MVLWVSTYYSFSREYVCLLLFSQVKLPSHPDPITAEYVTSESCIVRNVLPTGGGGGGIFMGMINNIVFSLGNSEIEFQSSTWRPDI